jgi:hypothetical protein
MGCLRRLGCLAVIAGIAVALYFTRERWLPHVWHGAKRETAALPTWQPLTTAGAKRAREALASLNQRNGPAYVNVNPGDLASYIVQELSRTLPPSADSIEAAAIGERLYVRARVRTSELGGKGGLGPLGALLGDREQMQLGGTLRIIKPGSAELRVREIKIHELSLPQALIPRLIQQMSRERPVGIAPDGLPLKTPPYIGDVRVSDGQITLYKAGPAR